MDALVGFTVAAYFMWAALLPIAAVVTGLTGRNGLLLGLVCVELLLMAALLLLPALLGEGWGSQGRAPRLIVQAFLVSVALAAAAHVILAWIKRRAA